MSTVIENLKKEKNIYIYFFIKLNEIPLMQNAQDNAWPVILSSSFLSSSGASLYSTQPRPLLGQPCQ